MKFCSLVLELHLPQNFCHRHTDTQTHRQTDRHFPKIVKSCSGHPKTCKSIENRKSKIYTKSILSSTYIEESKKGKIAQGERTTNWKDNNKQRAGGCQKRARSK